MKNEIRNKCSLLRTLALATCLLLGVAGAQAQITATPLAVTWPYNTPTDIELSASYAMPGPHEAFDYAIASPPAHGSLGSILNGVVRYTPAAGYVGEDSFTFTASTFSGGVSAPATVRMRVGQPVVLGLPGTQGDTGQTQCTDSTGSPVACAALTSHPGQDGRFGRDAQWGQAGAPAFDFAPLSGGCVQDRVTGLTWSTETLSLPWSAADTVAPTYTRCGITTGWRLPTRRELLSIVHHGAASPAIDGGAFPGTQSVAYWSRDTAATNAWAVDFSDGGTQLLPQAQTHAARLVARPVNQAPTITLGAAEITLPNDQRPGPKTYPGWATGIGPGSVREAGQQLVTSVRLLPVDGIKTLEFEVPPSIDLATGDLSFTLVHRIHLAPTDPRDPQRYYWASSAGRVRVEVTLQDDGGTADGGADTTVKSFDIAVSPVPHAIDINILHPWKAACVPVILRAQDIDTDPTVDAVFPKFYRPVFKIMGDSTNGYLVDYVASRSAVAKSISVPSDQDIPTDHLISHTGLDPGATGDSNARGFFAASMCWVPLSCTFVGTDTFHYTVLDVEGNESAPALVTIETFEDSHQYGCN